MRNLLGRLDARSLEELIRIASIWQIAPGATDRGALVGRLYQNMRDLPTLRDFWQVLPAAQRALISLLVIAERSPDAALTLAEIALALEISSEESHLIATELYRKGIVAREGDTAELPAGVAPELFVPGELAAAFNRLFDELDGGDRSQKPLPALLLTLDDPELEAAAAEWGHPIIPGLRGREEITGMIMERIADPARIEATVARLPRIARLIWQAVETAPGDGPLPLTAAIAATGLDPADNRQLPVLRNALTYLEDGLLVWHTYNQSGERGLFIPREVRVPGSAVNPSLQIPAAVEGVVETGSPPRTADAVAWDLLTMLRAIDDPQRPHLRDVMSASKRWRAALNDHLWNREDDLPPAGYLEFLASLAASTGVLVGEEPGGAPLAINPSMRHWRNRTFAEQTNHLIWWWLASPTWFEASGNVDVVVQGATWAVFRRRLLSRLQLLDPLQWYDLEAVATWLGMADPDMLGPAAVAATARAYDTGADEFGRRRAAVMAASEQTLLTACRWFGLVELGWSKARRQVVRVTPLTVAIAAHEKPGAGQFQPRSVLTVDAAGLITMQAPSPLQVWSCSAFAEIKTLGETTTWQVTEQMITRAVAAGHTVPQIVKFLEQQVDGAVPGALTERLHQWALGYRTVTISPAYWLRTVNPDQIDPIKARLDSLSWTTSLRGNALLAEPPAALSDQAARQELADVTHALHFTMVSDAASSPPGSIAASGEEPEM